MPLFSPERAAISSLVNQGRLYKRGFQVVAIAALATPIFMSAKLDRFTKGCFFVIGTTAAACWCLAEESAKRHEQIDKAYDQEQIKEFQRHGKITAKFQEAIATMDGYNQLTQKVISQPTWQWQRWVEQFGLKGLLPNIEQAAPVQELAISSTVSIDPSRQPSLSDLASSDSPVDYSWFNDAFIDASKGVFGAKGSGKSTYLAYESARFLQMHSDGILLIGDLHYDEDTSLWLPGVPSRVLLDKYLANKADKVLKITRWCIKELRDRIDKVDKKRPKIKLILDEFLGLLRRWTKEEQAEVIKGLEECQDEGRKFGVNWTLGLHSIKKGRTGIDSSVLFQMDLLVLGGSISDTTTPWPADFDIKKLSAERNMTQAMLNPALGFACVVRKQSEAPQVAVIPNLEINKLTVQAGGQNIDIPEQTEPDDRWYEELQSWAIALPQEPTPDQLAAKFQHLAGKKLDQSGMEFLTEEVKAWRSGDR